MTRVPLAKAIAAGLLLVALSGAANAQPDLFSANDRVSVATEPTLNAGVADLNVSSSIKTGMLYIDRDYVGKLPYSGSASPATRRFSSTAWLPNGARPKRPCACFKSGVLARSFRMR